MSFQSSSFDDPISEGGHINEDLLFTTSDYNSVNNANLLKDIESLIQNMERKQTRDNDSTMLDNIDNILSNIKLNESRPHSPQSNLSAEPIRMKSPITLRSRGDDKIKDDVWNIIDDIRNFVSNNIQEIVPDLVGQVEQELTTDLHDEHFDIAMANLDEFLRNRRDEEFDERHFTARNENDDSHDSGLEDFLRNRHDEEYNEINNSPRAPSTDDNANDIDDFFRSRQDEEFLEQNDESHNIELDASHDSITLRNQGSIGEKDHNLVVASSSSTKEDEASSSVNNIEKLAVGSLSNEAFEPDLPVDDAKRTQQLETLKYKSSYNLKILRQPAKRPKCERDFRKRNSLILASVLLDKRPIPTSRKAAKAQPLASSSVVAPDTFDRVSEPKNNINHHASSSESVEEKSERDLNEINVSGSERAETVPASDINGSSETRRENEVIETTIEAAAEVIINDVIEPSQNVINEDGARRSEVAASRDSHQDVNEQLQSFAAGSSSITMPTENDPTKAPQNLSELVEDTQRLIKQMKDEINAIYVSDDEMTSSEGSVYSDDWVDGEEYTDEREEEESEYTDWSGEYAGESERSGIAEHSDVPEHSEFIEHSDASGLGIVTDHTDASGLGNVTDHADASENINDIITASVNIIVSEAVDVPESLEQSNLSVSINAPEHTIPVEPNESANVPESNILPEPINIEMHINTPEHNESSPDESTTEDSFVEDSSNINIAHDNIELPEIRIIGFDPSSVNDTENAAAQSVVHGKLELTPMSSNQFKVDASIESGAAEATANDNDVNLNNSAATQEANDEADSHAAASSAENINNEIIETTTSIKEIVNEAINDVISVISDDEADDNVSQGSDNNESQIAGGPPQSTEHESSIVDSVMNYSENLSTEVMPKVYDNGNDSITSGNMLNDEANAGAIIMASNGESEKSTDGELKNDVDENGESEKPLTAEVNVTDNHVAVEAVNSERVEVVASGVESNLKAESQAEAAPDSNQKQKGAIAKTKIPAKVKTIKRKNSTAKESDKAFEDDAQKAAIKNNSPSSSPEKIKEPLKKPDNTGTPESNQKPVQTSRKNSFDAGTRKKSVGAPFGLLVSSNVKNLQKEFLNKASVPAPPKVQPTKLKPLKLATTKSLSKDPAPTFANKLTKLITPSSNNSKSNEKAKNVEQPRDHSKDVLPEKKYMEHCFSDEYPTSDEEEEEMKAPRSFFNKKPRTHDSDDETSDVSRRKRLEDVVFLYNPACV